MTWFYTFKLVSKTSLERLEKDFIGSFLKMGLKHNAVALIYSFKQGEHESLKDSVSRLKQYVNRCHPDEKPSQGRFISLFLEGLQNKVLHAHLYAQKHKTFQKCCVDAMDYDDNFEVSRIFGISSKSRSQDSRCTDSSTTTQEKFPTKEEIADLVLQWLR